MADKTWNYYLEQFDTKIINAGIDDSLSLSEQRVIKFINVGAIISGFFFIIVLLLAVFVMPDFKVISVCLLLAISYFLLPLINRLGFFGFSKFFAVLFFSAVIIFWNLYIAETPYFLLLPLTISSLFYTKHIQRIVAFSVFFAIFIHIKYAPYFPNTISDIFYDFCLFFAVLILIGFVHQSFQGYEGKMSALNESLLAQNKKLEQQQQLKKSEQFFRSIFENNYLGIVVLGAESEIKRVNPAFCEQLGFEEEYILERRFVDFNVKTLGCIADFKRLIKGEITHFETKETLRRSGDNIMHAQLIVNGVYGINGDFLEAILTVQDITETRQTQEALEESELKFRSLFDNSPLGITIRSVETDEIIEINNRALENLGLTKEQFYSIEKETLIGTSTDLEKDKAIIQKLIDRKEQVIVSKKSFFNSKKEEVFVEITRSLLQINGKDYIVSISKDITETFKVQEALRESELKFRTIFDNSPMGITIAHLTTEKVVDINQGALNALGFSREEFFEIQAQNELGKRTNISKDDEIIQRLLKKEEKAITTTKYFKKRNGKDFVAELTRSIININEEEYVVTVSKDITANIMIERERKVRYKEMQTFFDAIPISFLYVDRNNRILRGNKIALGEKPEIYEGKRVNELYPTRSKDYLKIHEQIFKTGLPIVNEIEQYQYKGKGIWARVDRIPVKDEKNEVVGLIIFTTDITEIKNAEGELAVKNAELEHYIETNLQLESFAYIASHDLKEPLRMIHSFTQLLNRRLKPHFDEDTTDYMNYVLTGVHRMQNLLDDLLKYSTIGRKEKNLELVDLNDTIYNVVQNVQHSVKEKKAEIYIEPLPMVKAFPIQMVQLFQNLISNAMKFVPDDRQPIINIQVKESLNDYEFEVRDNGIGIQKEYLQKIFLVFKRLHGKDEYEGTGIGLATCKKIIENLKGQIWVESEYGKGTSFFFTIPKGEN